MKIGTITKEQLLKSDRRARREADLIDSNKHKNKFGY
jgi:hypothetical protein